MYLKSLPDGFWNTFSSNSEMTAKIWSTISAEMFSKKIRFLFFAENNVFKWQTRSVDCRNLTINVMLLCVRIGPKKGFYVRAKNGQVGWLVPHLIFPIREGRIQSPFLFHVTFDDGKICDSIHKFPVAKFDSGHVNKDRALNASSARFRDANPVCN